MSRTGTSSGDGIRSKMLQKDYSTEQCLDILSAMGLGYTPDQAAKKAKSLTENVKSVELLDPRRMSTGSERLSDNQIGRNIFESVRNMIVQGSEPLIAVVKTNISLETYLSDVQSRMYELEKSISQLEQSYTEPVEPKEERLKLRLEVELENKEEELRVSAFKDFQERTRKGSDSRSGNTGEEGKKLPKVRSRRVVYDSESELDENWKDSSEFRLYEIDNKSYVKTATRKYKEDLLHLYTIYDQHVEEKEQALRELKIHRESMRRQQVLEIFVSELQKQSNIVVQKIKSSLMSYSFIREKLTQNVIVNGESIVQPLATDNLSGIYALLHQEYNKITMGAFCDYLMALMSETSSKDESNRNPQLQLKRMDKHLKTWLDMDLEKFMTPDHLFTICLLKSYHHDTNIRSEGVRHILEYSRRLESERMLKTSVGEYANMPLYTELVRWINDVQVKSMQFSSQLHTNRTTTVQSGNSTNSQAERKQYGMEQAAATNDISFSSGKKINARTNPPSNSTYASGPYDSEILFNRNLCAKSGFRYQALLHKCQPCTHQPRCYHHKCSKCGYYGHNDDDCCQIARKPVTVDTRQR
jgi:hypothetical protein